MYVWSQTIETAEQTAKFANTVKFIRTALKHIKILQFLLGVQFGTLNMFSNWTIVWRHTNLFSNQMFICPVRIICWIMQILNKHLPIQTQQYTCGTRCGIYSALVIKTPERRCSRVFFVNFEHIWHLVLVFFRFWLGTGKCLLGKSLIFRATWGLD